MLLMAKPKNQSGDVNSELQLIELLKSVLTDMFKGVHEFLGKLRDSLSAQETRQNERLEQIMTALETLTASVNASTVAQADLTTAVNAAIVRLGTPGATDAQLLSLAALVDTSTASDVALTSAINSALNAPPPAPVA